MNVIYQHLWDTFKSSEEKWGADQKKALTGTPTENEHQTGEKTVSLLRGKLLRLQWHHCRASSQYVPGIQQNLVERQKDKKSERSLTYELSPFYQEKERQTWVKK